MLLGELLKGDDVESSNRDRIALGPDLHAVALSDFVDNSSLRNEIKNVLREPYVEHGVIAQKHNQRKVKMRKSQISVDNASAE